MANRKILFALLVLCLSVLTVYGRGGRSSGRISSWSRGGSWGKGWGGSSSSGHNWGSSYKPSSSWSSGSSSGSSWKKPSYPSSSSGLSGFGSSGSTWSKPSYPSSSSGLSGSGNSWNKPSTTWSSSSGYGSHSYPSSSSGLSGSGTGSRYPSTSGSDSHSYPSNTGLSGGTSSGSSYRNKPYYNINTRRYDTHSYHYIAQTYYTAPQRVYVTQYRNSDSRYGDLLTGLTLYNMGRSHSHYHDHYYYDDYYRHRYNTGSYNNYNNGNNYHQSQSSYSKPQDEATCSLRINNDGKLEVLKIPCEIVSTFTEGGKKVESETHVNTTCTTNITIIPKLDPISFETMLTAVNITTCSNQTYTDPLSVIGSPLTAFDKMECLVDIRTKDAHFQNPVDCKTLIEYSKMPEPKQEEKPLLPPREKLKSWMEKPPWWLAIFFTV